MTRSIGYAAAALAALSVAMTAPAWGAQRDFAGAWKNANPNARDLSHLDFHREGADTVVHVWGKCQPTDCGWGTAHTRLYSGAATTPVVAGADTAIAEFERAGVQRMLMLTLDGAQIDYSVYTFFKTSRRPNYHSQGRMVHQ
jgi:hypothetical protein